MRSFNAVSVAVTGITVAYTGTSANATLPVAADGVSPNYCWFCSTTGCHIRLAPSGTPVAVTTDIYIPPNFPVPVNTKGNTKVAVVQDTTGGNLYVAPLEWAR